MTGKTVSARTIVCDGQSLQLGPDQAGWLSQLIVELNRHQWRWLIIGNRNLASRLPPALTRLKPVEAIYLDLARPGPPSHASQSLNQRLINNYLLQRQALNCPFMIVGTETDNLTRQFAGQGLSVWLYPDLTCNSRQIQNNLADLSRAELIIANDRSGAQRLRQAGIVDNQIVIAGRGPGQDFNQVSPQPGPTVIWPLARELTANDRKLASVWPYLRVLMNQPLKLIVIGQVNSSQRQQLDRISKTRLNYRSLASHKLADVYSQGRVLIWGDYHQADSLDHFLAASHFRLSIIAAEKSPIRDWLNRKNYHRYHDRLQISDLAHLIKTELESDQQPALTTTSQRFNHALAGKKISQALKQKPAPVRQAKLRVALISSSNRLADSGPAGVALAGRINWPKNYQIDHITADFSRQVQNRLGPGQHHYLATKTRPELADYDLLIYYLSAGSASYQVLARALIEPGIIVADSLRFQNSWQQLLSRGLIEQKRWQIEQSLEAKLQLAADCWGGYSLITRAIGLIVSTKSDQSLAQKLRSRPDRIKLLSHSQSLSKELDHLVRIYLKPAPDRILIDITSLADNWLNQSQLTGIQRYEHQLFSQSFNRTGISYVYYQTSRGRFSLIEPAIVSRLLDLINRQQTKGRVWGLVKKQTQLMSQLQNSPRALIARTGDRLFLSQGVWDNDSYQKTVLDLNRQLTVYQVVHDLIPIVKPKYSPQQLKVNFNNYFNQILPAKLKLIAISQNSASDIRKYYRQHKLKANRSIRVIPPGDDPVDLEINLSKIKPVIKGDFLLTVSTVQIRKNHRILIDIYRLAARQKLALPPTVIVGTIGWGVSDFLATVANDDYLKSKIIIKTRINDWQLAWLYSNCQLTIFSSLYEGWGLPVAESLAWGCPTLVARTSSLPEVGGRLADYFDVNQPRQLLKLIKDYQDPKVNQTKRRLIKKHHRGRSWQQAASQTFDYLLE